MQIETLNKLKDEGYTHIASIIKNVFSTNYYNLQTIDAILNNNGKWIAAQKGTGKYKRGIGIKRSEFPVNSKVIFKSQI